jgi:F0F1-type ATP synthase assembly protein I
MPLDNNQKKPENVSPPAKKAKSFATQFGLALELPFVLAGTIALGGLVGYLIDKWLHTRLIFMFIFGGLGFFAGLRDILRRLPADGDGKG